MKGISTMDTRTQPTKICEKCKVEKPLTGFATHTTHRDGFYSICKNCQAINRKDKKEERIEELKDKAKNPNLTKICKNCGVEKSLSGFRIDALCVDGFVNTCIECYKEKTKQTRQDKKLQKEVPLTKICVKCRKEKSGSEFFNNYGCADGLENQCKECKRALRDKRIEEIEKEEKPATKLCNRCLVDLPLSYFYLHPTGEFGVEAMCKRCKREYRKGFERQPLTKEDRRKWRLKYTYGITPEQYEKMLVEQDYKCAICKTDLNTTRQVCIDHRHDETKKVRGILCDDCNIALGRIKDSVEVAKNLIEYLENTS